MAIKGCIFDLDGTLVDSMWVWTAVGQEFLAKRGLDSFDGFSERLAQLGFNAGAAEFVQRWHLNERPADIVDEWQSVATEKYATEVRIKPHAADFLRSLKAQGIKLAVATANNRKPLELTLQNNDVLDLFDATIVVDEVTDKGKSTPEVYWAAQRMLGLEVEECIVFEDVLAPAKQAHAGGFKVIGVYDDSPAQDHDALREEADFFIESYEDLAKIDLLSLFQGSI